jgi:Rieske Fe-S protein
MSDRIDTTGTDSKRRRVLGALMTAALATLGGSLASVLGAFAFAGMDARRTGRWVRAAALSDLKPGIPRAVVVSVMRQSGWFRSRSREVVYLTALAEGDVHAMSAVCTHLGCLVSWDPTKEQFLCPCHGGVYDRAGNVIAGPPPRSLDTVSVRVQKGPDESAVLVRM